MPPTLSQLSTWTVMLLRSMSSISSFWLHNPELMPPLHPLPLLSFPSFSLPSWFVDIHAGVLISVWHVHLLLPFLQALGKAELSHCFHSIPPTLSHPIPSSKVMKPVKSHLSFWAQISRLSFSVLILSTLRYRLPRLQIWFSLFILFLRIIILFFHFPCCFRVFYFIRFYGFAALAGALFRMSLVKKQKQKQTEIQFQQAQAWRKFVDSCNPNGRGRNSAGYQGWLEQGSGPQDSLPPSHLCATRQRCAVQGAFHPATPVSHILALLLDRAGLASQLRKKNPWKHQVCVLSDRVIPETKNKTGKGLTEPHH